MIVKQYIKQFEQLGFGLFVHFGIYSLLEKGEWALQQELLPQKEYDALAQRFSPDPNWARELVSVAKSAGCKYITLTTRHHDGYSLFDTCGLSTYDAPHSCGRDLVREFVDACREEEIIPFFYHTLIDWHHPDYPHNWEAYMDYLNESVALLCKNYGPVGGFWFDGYWEHRDKDWQEDRLYGMIRSYQPEAMIINNTGLSDTGALGHLELDSVTFERTNPRPINQEGAPKYIASEMCEVFNDHWGYAKADLHYKSPASLIETLAYCRKHHANLLINAGPLGNGILRTIDRGYMEIIGQWVTLNDEAIRCPSPGGIPVAGNPKDFLLRDGDNYYLFCHDIPMITNEHVGQASAEMIPDRFELALPVKEAYWLDNGAPVVFSQKDGQVCVTPAFTEYGRSLVIRVAKLIC